MQIRLSDHVLRAPDDGAAGGAGAGATQQNGGAGSTGADAGQAQGGGGAASPQPYRPEGLPDHFFGKDDRETVDKLYGAYKGAREAIGDVPADAAGYKFEPVDAVKPYAQTLENDPFFGKVRAAALEHKIPAKAFNGFLNKIMGEMIEGDMVAEPFSADKEMGLLVPGETDPARRRTEADRISRENIATVETWKQQGMPPAVADWLTGNLDRAAANQLVGWARGLKGEQAPALQGRAGGAISEADIDARVRDPRGNISDPKFDKAFAAETDRMFKAFYGEGART